MAPAHPRIPSVCLTLHLKVYGIQESSAASLCALLMAHSYSFGAQATAKGYSPLLNYIFGWKESSLQQAMDSSCMFDACGNGRPLKS